MQRSRILKTMRALSRLWYLNITLTSLRYYHFLFITHCKWKTIEGLKVVNPNTCLTKYMSDKNSDFTLYHYFVNAPNYAWMHFSGHPVSQWGINHSNCNTWQNKCNLYHYNTAPFSTRYFLFAPSCCNWMVEKKTQDMCDELRTVESHTFDYIGGILQTHF